MSEAEWFEAFFGPDYFEIYRGFFTPEGTAGDVTGIVSLLGLPAGARILDLACGHGRHAIPLAERGFEVTGYDLSETFLERGRSEAAARGAVVRWVRGDMRALQFEGEFDAVINIFTAFGYFADEADDLETLRRVARALVPGGRLLLETLHRDGLVVRFQPRIEYKTTSGAHVVRNYVWDLARGVIDDRVELTRPDGSRAEYASALRVRALNEWLALLRAAGLEPLAWHGGLDGSPLTLTSRRLALVAVAPERLKRGSSARPPRPPRPRARRRA